MADFLTTLITPQGTLFSGKTEMLSVPGAEGSLGILANHAPLVAALKKGVLKLSGPGVEKFYLILSGVLEVNASHEALVLADEAFEAATLQEAQSKLYGSK